MRLRKSNRRGKPGLSAGVFSFVLVIGLMVSGGVGDGFTQASQPSDVRIASEVRTALATHPGIPEDRISVAVSDGTVSLSGTVNSIMEEEDAVDDAWQAATRPPDT